jgi:hypothetical protein
MSVEVGLASNTNQSVLKHITNEEKEETREAQMQEART